jgi:YidC/Oxa1 family membrane protein insertase
MALYKEHGVNPLAGCLPMVIQLPLLLGLFYAINSQIEEFNKPDASSKFAWIGSSLANAVNGPFEAFKASVPALGHFLGIQTEVDHEYAVAKALEASTTLAHNAAEAFNRVHDAAHQMNVPAIVQNHVNPYGVVHLLAPSLAYVDVTLLVLYIISMYLTVRYGSPPSSDPQQAQTQKIMAFVSPAMIGWFGFTYKWASALLIYWLALNILTMAQQFFMYRKYGLIGGPKPALAEPIPAKAISNGKSAPLDTVRPPKKNGSSSGRSRRSKR